jgi:UDP-2-acetamido-2,6-beta-L-arabino-hexul-4-ose reductase
VKILVTGAKGFIGKNLVEALKNIQYGKDKTRDIVIDELFLYDLETPIELLNEYCRQADFVFHLAGINRPKNESEFHKGNFGSASQLLDYLKAHDNRCPVMLSSSVQAALCGRFESSAYGKSKRDGEQLFFEYAQETGATVYVFRFPNVFGKWCKPNYNSAVATFCSNIANDLPIQVNDRNTELELVYIDDVVRSLLDLLHHKANKCDYDGTSVVPTADGRFSYVPTTYATTLGEIVDLLYCFHAQPVTLQMPAIESDSLAKKLYATYLSYLPKTKVKFAPKMNIDMRGSFTELLKTSNGGQFSVNISKPGVTKGEHWHNSKWEFFIVVSGRALIQERKIGTDEIWEFEVNGDTIEIVHMLPGFTHNIINLSENENLVTLMWANEQFDQAEPDTYFEKVVNT